LILSTKTKTKQGERKGVDELMGKRSRRLNYSLIFKTEISVNLAFWLLKGKPKDLAWRSSLGTWTGFAQVRQAVSQPAQGWAPRGEGRVT
jgi:hypothetical protein